MHLGRYDTGLPASPAGLKASMPAVNPRITVTLTPAMHAILRRLSELTGNSQSSMVGELLQSSQHVFERMAAVLEAAHKLKAEGMKAPDQMRESLEAAQAKLESQLGIAYEQMDEGFRPILDEAEKVSRRAGAGAGTGRRAARPAPAPATARGAKPPISNRGVTPHPKGSEEDKKQRPRSARKAG